MTDLNRKIFDNEDQFRYIIEHANDFILILSDKFEFEYVNEIPHYKGAGYLKDELIGKPALDFIHLDDHKKRLLY